MILEFKCSNFRSINSEIDFNMQATADKKFEENLIEFDGKKFLKSAEIYGPNGSGKSTLLKAIWLMKEIVCNSNENKDSKKTKLPTHPHRLNKENPTHYSMWFEKNGKKYFYEFSYTQDKIYEENLYFCDPEKSKKMITVFERENDTFSSGDLYSEDFGYCDKELNDKKLLLSVANDRTKIEPVKEAFSFFDEDIIIWQVHDIDWTEEAAKKLQDDMNFKETYVKFLQDICPCLKDVEAKVETKQMSMDVLPDDMPDELKQYILKKQEDIHMLDIKLNYQDFSLKLSEESDGTQLIFDMLTPLMRIISENKVFICDELETHLHPALCKRILRFFYENTDSRSQFIFTTHNMELLDQNIIRRDQVWFTEIKTKGRETELYSLAEYNGVRNDENLRRGYIEHRYGSWPNIEHF